METVETRRRKVVTLDFSRLKVQGNFFAIPLHIPVVVLILVDPHVPIKVTRLRELQFAQFALIWLLP